MPQAYRQALARRMRAFRHDARLLGPLALAVLLARLDDAGSGHAA